jgi:hypothetical protein
MGHRDDRLASQRGWIAHLVTRALTAGGASEVSYDSEQFLLRFRSVNGSPTTANLTNLFADCLGASADDRATRIDRFVAALTATSDVPDGWDQVAPLLRPVLRPAGYAQGSGQIEQPLARPFQPLLHELVVIDQPNLMAYVNLNNVREWGVGEVAVFERARTNLAALAAGPLLEPGQLDRPAILRLVDSGNEYWASCLLIDGWLSSLAEGVGGRPVAFLPDPTGLIITSDESDEIRQFLEMVEKSYLEASRPLSPQAYTVDEAGRVVPYSVPADDPLWTAVHRSEVLFASREYAAQKEQHDELTDGYVAPLMVQQRPDGALRTVTVWGEGVFGLLPQADYVAFVSEELQDFTVTWETAVRETGLVPEPGWYPDRYRIHGWPHTRVLERLRAAARPL